VSKRFTVRVLFSHDRAIEAEHELTELVAQRPYRQGTAPERLWDFRDLEQAQRFRVNAENTTGVAKVWGPDGVS
jgi:hypothetical protein